jgi:RNA polymerase sigma factor (sigma-70 family)
LLQVLASLTAKKEIFMQPTQISSETEQSEQIELIQIARLRNRTNATPLDVRKSDRAFSKLFQSYEKCLYKLAKSILGRNAEEYFHVALDRFQKAVESFEFIGTFSGWVVYKVRKALLDQARKPERSVKGKAEKNLSFVDNLDLELIAPHQASTNHQNSEYCREDLTEVNDAIGQLTDYQREIIWLYNEGYSWPEIGQIVGKTPDAARMDRHRAILFVRTALGIETKANEKKKTPPVITWMRRLCDRFHEKVRTGVESDDIRSVVLPPLSWCLSQLSKTYQSSFVTELFPSAWAICRGVANNQQAPPKSSIPDYSNSFLAL